MVFKVLVSDPIKPEGLTALTEAPEIDVDIKTDLSKEELLNIIDQYDALIVRSQTKVTAEVLEKGTKLRVIGRAGVGVDNIDLNEATKKGIVVINAPDGNTISTAEHTFSMLCSVARRIPQAYYTLKNHKWDRKAFVGVELSEKTLGIIGLGRIGAEVAKRAKAFNMSVIAFDPFLTEEKAEKLGIGYGTLEDVLKSADFITLHTPLLKETRHLISHDQFAIMKDGVRILNCARGGLVDEDALYEAIINKKVAGAALDVFEEEPADHNRLLELPEVIGTPHLGASTKEAQDNVAIDVSKEIYKILLGQPFKNAVNLPSIPAELMKKVEPYLTLCEKLGSFIAQLGSGAAQEVNISYAGELADIDVSPLTRNVIKGILSFHLGTQVNHINANHLAKEREITVNEQKTTTNRGFTNLIVVELVTTNGKKEVRGTLLNGYGARIVKVNDYSVDIVPEGHIVYIKHHDRPGAIGRVGTLLGAEDVNIATMQVGRSNAGGDAIMMLTVDKVVPEETLNKLTDLEEIDSVTEVDL